MNIFRELYSYREMLYNLIHKNLRARYVGTVLGFLWTMLNPLLQLAVYTVVFSVILRAGIDKYYLFLFVALIPWIFFANSLNGGAGIIVQEKNLVTKTYFPREILPISHVITQFVNMLYAFVVVLAVSLLFGDHTNLLAWLYLPIVMAVEFIFALGCVLVVSAITVYLRDLEFIMPIFTMALQFLTPIMYSHEVVPERLMPIFLMNPMTSIIIAYRDILYYGKYPELQTLLMPFVLSLIILILGFLIFRKLQRGFAEEL